LMYKPFKKILSSYENTPMREQRELLNNEFESWRGAIEQIDDICIIGFQV
jgi:serine phosphatase RsbU (regulator of sigma subunit)